jgi:hypothetical protein
MDLPVTLLRINAVLFLVFGLGFLFEPALLSKFVTDGVPATTGGLIDMRATYGGMAFGFGAFLARCAWDQRAVKHGIVASVLVMFGLALGRVLGIVVDRSPNTMMFVLLLAEVLFGVLLMWALAKASNSKASS